MRPRSAHPRICLKWHALPFAPRLLRYTTLPDIYVLRYQVLAAKAGMSKLPLSDREGLAFVTEYPFDSVRTSQPVTVGHSGHSHSKACATGRASPSSPAFVTEYYSGHSKAGMSIFAGVRESRPFMSTVIERTVLLPAWLTSLTHMPASANTDRQAHVGGLSPTGERGGPPAGQGRDREHLQLL